MKITELKSEKLSEAAIDTVVSFLWRGVPLARSGSAGVAGDLHVGFEFEVAVDPSSLESYFVGQQRPTERVAAALAQRNSTKKYSDLLQIYSMAHAGGYDHWRIEPDITLGYYGAEIVTMPYQVTEAKQVLSDVLEFIRDAADDGIMTSKDTALQMTFGKLTNVRKLDLLKLALLSSADHIASGLDRLGNWSRSVEEYILSKVIRNMRSDASYEEISAQVSAHLLAFSPKPLTINFQKLNKGLIEFRPLGNAGYEDDEELCQSALDIFAASIMGAMDPSIMEKETGHLFDELMRRR